MNNPKTALDAMLETEHQTAGLTIRPITTARYALLELLESPFVNPDRKFTVMNIVPSLYVCTAEIDRLRGYSSRNVEKLEADAVEWSEGVDLDKVGPAVDEIMKRFDSLFKIAPGTGGADDAKKKLETTTTTAS